MKPEEVVAVIIDIVELMGRAYKDENGVANYKRARDWLEGHFIKAREELLEAAKAAKNQVAPALITPEQLVKGAGVLSLNDAAAKVDVQIAAKEAAEAVQAAAVAAPI